MRKQKLALAAIFALSACGVLAAQSSQPISDTYQWSGELVSFDETTKIATIKARAVDQDAVTDLKRFKAGERALLWWSGFERHADAIRRVMPYTENRKSEDRFLLPVELVSTDAPNQYVTFRLRVPDGSVSSVKSVRPGEWVTATSSHRVATASDAIVSMKPYTTSSAGSSN